MRKEVFLDCGANNGCSVLKFRAEFDRNCVFHIHSFEPNPHYRQNFAHIKNHSFHQAAVWIEDGESLPFYLDRRLGIGSSLLSNKLPTKVFDNTLDLDHSLKVQTVDLSSWIKANFSPYDTIFLKLDIEGAEYAVLSRMLEQGTLAWIDRLFVDWHWHKLPELGEETHTKVVSAVSAVVPIETWDACEYDLTRGSIRLFGWFRASGEAELLRRWFSHYMAAGIFNEELQVAQYGIKADHATENALADLGISPLVLEGREELKEFYLKCCAEYRRKPDQWHLWTGHLELHHYAWSIRSFLSACDRAALNCVRDSKVVRKVAFRAPSAESLSTADKELEDIFYVGPRIEDLVSPLDLD